MSHIAASGPSGTVTMLFTDVEGSTAAARALGDRWSEVLTTHHHILEQTIRDHHGVVEGTEGDAVFATFTAAPDALAAAREAQEALRAHAWPGGGRRRGPG